MTLFPNAICGNILAQDECVPLTIGEAEEDEEGTIRIRFPSSTVPTKTAQQYSIAPP
jgi:hypothetical protein